MKQSIKPKVSVCVVTYNHEKYIRQCLQSIIDQEVDFPFELIVGDDCSSDSTRQIIQEFAERYPDIVRIMSHERNVGPTENYLIVHNQAIGEYVCHCDGDDYWLPEKLKRQVEFMDSNPSVVQSWHRQHIVDANSRPTGTFPKRFPHILFDKHLTLDDLALSYGLVGQHSSQMYRKAARSVKQRDRPTIDYFFALDIASQGLSAHIPEFLGYYRVVVGGSVTQGARGRDLVDICVSEAVAYYAKRFPNARAAFRANLSVRALGAMLRKRKNWRTMMHCVSTYPMSLTRMVRSFFIFACHRL